MTMMLTFSKLAVFGIVTLLMLLANFSASAQNVFQDGGIPLKFKEVTGKESGNKYLLVTTTGERSKYIFKLLSMEDGQPRTLLSRRDVITRLDGRAQVGIDEMVAAIQRPAFTIHLRRLKNGKLDNEDPEYPMLVLTREATRNANTAKPMTEEQRLILTLDAIKGEAKSLAALRDNRLLPIYQKVKKVKDVWQTLSTKESKELTTGMELLAKRHEVLSKSLDEARVTYVFGDVQKLPAIDSLLKDCEFWIAILDDFNGLRNDLIKIERLNKQFQEGVPEILRSIATLRAKVKREREQKLDRLDDELRDITRKVQDSQDRFELGLRTIAVDIAIRQDAVAAYQTDVERYNAEVEAYNAEVEASYYNRVDYGDGGWSGVHDIGLRKPKFS
jgi:hypothetical protein